MNLHRGLLPVVLVSVAAALLPAQQGQPQSPFPPYTPPTQQPGMQQPGVPQGQQPGVQPGNPQPAVQPVRQMLEALHPTWIDLPGGRTFQGFPVFPQRLTGYGAYPRPGGVLDPKDRPVAVLVPAEPEPPGWPRWARMKEKQPLPYAENLALLVRHGDRVWWRGVDDDAFVPLFFHDKFTTLGVGSQVEVRQAGEFELLLHDSTRIVSHGPSALRLAAMDQTTVTVEVQSLTRLRVLVSRRDHTFVLPDGSKIRIPPPPKTAEPIGPALVFLQRDDEPGWHGGRATVFNAGQRPVIWQHAFGETALAPGHRVVFFLQPPSTPLPAPVVAEGITLQKDGRALQGSSAGPSQVSWCGARFAVPAGTSLRLDPMQGQPFALPSGNIAPEKTP